MNIGAMIWVASFQRFRHSKGIRTDTSCALAAQVKSFWNRFQQKTREGYCLFWFPRVSYFSIDLVNLQCMALTNHEGDESHSRQGYGCVFSY